MSYGPTPTPLTPGRLFGFIGVVVAAVVAFMVIIVIIWWGFAAFGRYQARANAHNETITTQKQIRIAENLAQARYQTAIGLKRSQDEIRKTLTPLYVQFELVQALQQIATSGKNNSVIYLPTNPVNGLPIVPTSNIAPQAGK